MNQPSAVPGKTRFLHDRLQALQSILPAGLLSLLFFLVPLFPDVKMARPKLLLVEFGLSFILFAGLFLSALNGRLRLRQSFLTAPLLCYGGLTVLLYFLSPDRLVAASELKRSLLSLAAFFVAAHVLRSGTARYRLAGAWLAGMFCAALYGILQHTGGFGPVSVPRFDRVMSTFGNPIFFSAALVAALPLGLGLFASTGNKLIRGLLAVFTAAVLAALYLAQTRAAFIACAASLAVFFWLNARTFQKKLAALAAVAALFVLVSVGTKDLWARQQSHLLIWRDTLSLWLHHPVLGTGPGTFHLYFPGHASDDLKKLLPQDRFIVNDAHNEYLQTLSETGVAGLGVFLWLLVSFFAGARKTFGRIQGPERYLYAGAVSSAAAVLAQNLFSVDMRFIISSVYLFLAMGICASFEEEREITFAPPAQRGLAALVVALTAALTFTALGAPYLAQKRAAAEPEFFEEKLLEPAKTLHDLEALAAQYPGKAVVFEKLGWVYAKEKNWKKAIENYEKAAALGPANAGPFNNLGNIYYLLGEHARAVECWTRSLALNPSQADSRLNLATAYYYQGRLKEAASQLKEVLKTDPENGKALLLLKQMTD
ncbi:MAG: tetratricopeptide repeat protein [Endomicrobiales bacterium]